MLAQSIEIRQAVAQDRLPIYRMLELYQHDLSDIWSQDLDAHGEYGYALDRFWDADSHCHSFVATVAGNYAGFALVDASVKVGTSGHWMDQFFVLKKYRRCGIGRTMARQVFATMPGQWEVGEMLNNQPAQAFWRKVIQEHTAGSFVEHKLAGGWWEGYVQCFGNAKT